MLNRFSRKKNKTPTHKTPAAEVKKIKEVVLEDGALMQLTDLLQEAYILYYLTVDSLDEKLILEIRQTFLVEAALHFSINRVSTPGPLVYQFLEVEILPKKKLFVQQFLPAFEALSRNIAQDSPQQWEPQSAYIVPFLLGLISMYGQKDSAFHFTLEGKNKAFIKEKLEEIHVSIERIKNGWVIQKEKNRLLDNLDEKPIEGFCYEESKRVRLVSPPPPGLMEKMGSLFGFPLEKKFVEEVAEESDEEEEATPVLPSKDSVLAGASKALTALSLKLVETKEDVIAEIEARRSPRRNSDPTEGDGVLCRLDKGKTPLQKSQSSPGAVSPRASSPDSKSPTSPSRLQGASTFFSNLFSNPSPVKELKKTPLKPIAKINHLIDGLIQSPPHPELTLETQNADAIFDVFMQDEQHMLQDIEELENTIKETVNNSKLAPFVHR